MQKSKQASIAFQTWAYDTRVVARNIVDGVITPQDVKHFLGELPDVAAKAETMHTSRPGHDDDDDDDNDMDESDSDASA
jgi:hypothetical protein